MECTNLTPQCVLKTSGHVDKFCDKMVKDVETGECFRADKLLEEVIDALIDANPAMPVEEVEKHRRVQIQADAYSIDEIHALFGEYNIKGQDGHELSKPFDFNLMFEVATKTNPCTVAGAATLTRCSAFNCVDPHWTRGHLGGISPPRNGAGSLRELPPPPGLQRKAHALRSCTGALGFSCYFVSILNGILRPPLN